MNPQTELDAQFGEPTTLGVAEAIWYVKNVCEAEPTWANVRAILFRMLPLVLNIPPEVVSDQFAAQSADKLIRAAVLFGCVDVTVSDSPNRLERLFSIDEDLAQQIAARHAGVAVMPPSVRWERRITTLSATS